ncbi:MAG: hypothetical protein ACRDGS_09835, partial [Chloroflexota bacterium]
MSEITPALSARDNQVNRKTFLKGSAATLAAASATVALGAAPASVWAEKAKTISMVGKAVVTLNFAIWGNTSQNIATWTPATDL